MPRESSEVIRLLRQQAAIAGFGSFALRQTDLMAVLTEAARVCADGLSVPFCKVCRYREREGDLLIEAGFGWSDGVVGHAVSRADETSPQGRAFVTGEPSICNDLQNDTVYKLPAFYAEYCIVSSIDVVIKGDKKPYGVLQVDSNVRRNFDQYDINFLTGFANVLAEAVATSTRIAGLEKLVAEKDVLLEQKNILAEELQHRVRNNMQLVLGMLNQQIESTNDVAGKRGLKSIARRVTTIAQIYDHLLGNEMTRMSDFGNYVNALCNNIAEIHPGGVVLTCFHDSVVLELDVVTALGIVVAELVTNAYDHAFPAGNGTIDVSLRAARKPGGIGTLVISDTGTGFVPKYESKRHGLGLVQRLIKQVRGSYSVVSDIGTTWTIDFPVPAPAA